MDIVDFDLSKHFTLYELTVTSNKTLQEANRDAAVRYIPSLKALAEQILEPIRGDRPLKINSAFRSAELNNATIGSSPTSQHPLGQAADIHRPGQSSEDLFAEILGLFKSRGIKFGQLINESAQRDYGLVSWVHVSLGRDFWKPERCGEVLRKWDDKDGKPHFELVEKVKQEVA